MKILQPFLFEIRQYAKFCGKCNNNEKKHFPILLIGDIISLILCAKYAFIEVLYIWNI